MKRTEALLGGLAIGAGLVYFLDPEHGPRRREVVREKVARGLNDSRDFLDEARHDLSNRAQGLAAEVKSRVLHRPEGDDALVERVRSTLSHLTSHPHAIEVEAHEGCVTLRGAILEEELAALLSAITAIPGVETVADQLESHATSENVPALQEEAHLEERLEGNWTPGVQLLSGLVSGVALIYGTSLLRSHAPRSVSHAGRRRR